MKLAVLFVDDEANIIGGIKRMMHHMKNEWDLLYANSGKEAMELLDSNHVDVIISDIRMPGIDGTQLLTYVKENFPQIVRITLSGYANDNLALRNTRIVHQSLSKPTTPENIKDTIEKAYRLRQKLNNEELLSIVNGIDNLPSLPEIYLKLEEEINSPNSSIDKLGNIISNDPIITAKILQLTNSAFFGLPTRIANIKQALNFLGIKTIQNLVLSIKLFKSIDANSPYVHLYESIWHHSNKTAYLAQHIAKVKSLDKSTIEDSFLSGLLHDIGKLILLENTEIKVDPKNLDFSDIENKFSNTTHADIGAYLLGIWGLPDTIVEAVAFHHFNNSADNSWTPSKIVYYSNILVKKENFSPLDIDSNNIDDIIKNIDHHHTEEKA